MSVIESRIDPRQSNYITILGRKGSGKSYLAARLWETWPYDRLAIDPTGDARVGDDVERLEDPLPIRWPALPDKERRSSLHYVPDVGSATYSDDLDRAVGLAFGRGRCLMWLDEVGELTRANRTPPNMRRFLHQGRHKRISALMCGPRPIDVDPLVISQADYVYLFHLPHPRDKERVAGCIGIKPDELAAAIDALGEHCYLRYDARTRDLVEFPPLPARRSASRDPQ